MKNEITNMNKPLLAMSEIERERAWDKIHEPIGDDLLKDARASAVDTAIVFAAVILVAADGSRRCLTHVAEYGDAEGISNMLDLVRQLRRSGQLLDGERVEVVTLEKPFDQFQWRPVAEPRRD